MPTITISSNYTASLADDTILIDASSNSVNLTLPPSHPIGKRFTVKLIAGGVFSSNILTSNLIDGLSSFPLTVNKQAVIVHSDGSNWFIL